MTPCLGQQNFRPCASCVRYSLRAVMRPVVKLQTCAMYEPNPAKHRSRAEMERKRAIATYSGKATR